MIDADRDLGDFCPTEARYIVPDVYHPSHAPATLQPVAPRTEAGKAALAAIRAALPRPTAPEPRQFIANPSWTRLPQLYRQMLVHAAGLPPSVVDAKDRELSERDKVMLRSAISDMRDWLGTLVTL